MWLWLVEKIEKISSAVKGFRQVPLVIGQRVLHSDEVAADVRKLTSFDCMVLRHSNEGLYINIYLYISLSFFVECFVFDNEDVFQLAIGFIWSCSTRVTNIDELLENLIEMQHPMQKQKQQQQQRKFRMPV